MKVEEANRWQQPAAFFFIKVFKLPRRSLPRAEPNAKAITDYHVAHESFCEAFHLYLKLLECNSCCMCSLKKNYTFSVLKRRSIE